MARPKRFVYIMNSTSDPARYYTGVTSNLRARLTAHNEGRCRASTPRAKAVAPKRRSREGGRVLAANEASHATPDHASKVPGLFYFTPRDLEIWVENRVGVVYTLNIGNLRAWLLIIAIMLAPMVAARLLF